MIVRFPLILCFVSRLLTMRFCAISRCRVRHNSPRETRTDSLEIMLMDLVIP